MLEDAGFEIKNLGTAVPPEKFVEAIKAHSAEFVGIRALLFTTMPLMKTLIDALQEAGVRGNVKVMIGGATATQKYAEEIGADISWRRPVRLLAEKPKRALQGSI